jgi:predicted DCC family thiol-disulfide oxidoreductase YuxK
VRLRDRLLEGFALDLRTLALFRAALAAVILVDLALRAFNLEALYTDFGVLPRSEAVGAAGPYRIDLFLFDGQAWTAALLFIIEGFAALCLFFGHRTRLALLACLVLHASLVNRNPLVLIGGDNLVCCLLFWSLFLPVSARWSMDAALSTTPPPQDNRHLSFAGAALVLQVLSVYFFSALLKRGVEWWPGGTAIYYAMSLDSYSSALGQWLLNFPHLLQGLSWYVWVLELVALPLALSPVFNRPLRFAVMLMLMAMHTGFLLCMEIMPFPLMSLASLTVLCGGWVWDALGRRHAARNPGAVRIYYDRDCAFCLKSCLVLREFLMLRDATIAPAQDTPRAKALLEANYSWVVIDTDDQAYLKWPAFTVLVRRSPLAGWKWPLLRMPLWLRPGNAVYDFVGRHRGALGQVTSWLWPRRDVRFESGRVAQRIALAFLLMVGAWNGLNLLRPALPRWAQITERVLMPPLYFTRTDQIWDMFAPYPLKEDGWFVVPARLRDGSEIDLRRAAPVDYAKPGSVADAFGDLRWKTYLMHLWSQTYSTHRLFYGRYLCRSWNRTRDRDHQLMTFKIEYMLERTPPPGITPTVERQVLWRHECFPDETKGQIP